MKPVLRQLNNRNFSGISLRVKEQAAKVLELQRLLLTIPDRNIAREEHEAIVKWQTLITAEEKFYRQKSRVRWLHLGDRNTTFFHRAVAQRASRNHIHFLKNSQDQLLTSIEEIKSHSADYFKGIIGSTEMPISPVSVEFLQTLMQFRCSDEQKVNLVSNVSVEEVKATLFAMPLNKSPGPDGFSVEFFRASWETVGNDVVAAVKEFFRNGRLLKDLNNTSIALIPKQPEACHLGDYRPISCCNLIYKLISKIIANRLKPALLGYISRNQAAFLKGRSMGENFLLTTELIRNYEELNYPRSCMLKVDIRKAFDTVCWNFVTKMLEAHDFPPLFVSWINQCISSPRFSIAINGELAGFFPGKKGLRQGDSISPYLFIMVMETLSAMLDKAVDDGEIRLHPSCADPRITHLLFADDLLIFSDGSRHSLTGIKDVMSSFKDLCGLDVNPAKSEIFFGGYDEIQIGVLCGMSGFKLGTFPTRYLGLPLNPKRITLATLQPFIEKVTNKIHSWTTKPLSFA